ncbi:hypothetical protein BDR26DRAFT_857988 [Obelidium mucronatum]|nr:hypothetical protein BDR26DRAFT_857988 [Obelidium mucronatum]
MCSLRKSNSMDTLIEDKDSTHSPGSTLIRSFSGKKRSSSDESTKSVSFHCAYREGYMLYQGKIYLSSSSLLFRSPLHSDISILIKDITDAKKTKFVGVNTSLVIETRFKEYFFASFLHRDTCHDAVQDILEAFRLSNSTLSSISSSPTQSLSRTPSHGDCEQPEHHSFTNLALKRLEEKTAGGSSTLSRRHTAIREPSLSSESPKPKSRSNTLLESVPRKQRVPSIKASHPTIESAPSDLIYQLPYAFILVNVAIFTMTSSTVSRLDRLVLDLGVLAVASP